MAVLDTKLHIKKNNVTQECSIYTSESDGTPINGAVWPVKVNGTSGFIGLYPGDKAGPFPTLLPYKLNGVNYTVQSQVVNMFAVTIAQSSNQTISVTCNGEIHTDSFIAPVGAAWTADIKADIGYNAGALTASSGIVTGDITISATAAIIKTYLVTINQPANGSVTASYNGIVYNTNFMVPHGASVTFTCAPNSGYRFISFTVG